MKNRRNILYGKKCTIHHVFAHSLRFGCKNVREIMTQRKYVEVNFSIQCEMSFSSYVSMDIHKFILLVKDMSSSLNSEIFCHDICF